MTVQTLTVTAVFVSLLAALLSLCSYVACQASGGLLILRSRRLGHLAGKLLMLGWFMILAVPFAAVAIAGLVVLVLAPLLGWP